MSVNVCSRCGSSVSPNDSYCPFCRQPVFSPSSTEEVKIASFSRTTFGPPVKTTYLLCFILIAEVFLSVVAIGIDLYERDVLRRIDGGHFATQEEAQITAEVSDLISTLTGLVQVMIAIGGGIVFLFWTYYTCRFASEISRISLPVSPGWAVGYYFIPILNLFKPYVALRDVYRACLQPMDWTMASTSSLILVWWWMHIIDSVVSRIIWKANPHLKTDDPTMEQLLQFNGIVIVGDTMTLLTSLLALLVVLMVDRQQRSVSAMS